MDKLLIKILIFVFAAGFIPSIVFGFFSEPDPYIHSMPFGVQKNYPGDKDASPPPSFQLYESKTNNDSHEIADVMPSKAVEKKGVESGVLAKGKNLFLPAVLGAVFLAIFAFLVIKIIKSKN